MKDFKFVEVFVMIACTIVVWFIARSMYTEWVQTYSDYKLTTLGDVCYGRGGHTDWAETVEGDVVFRCYFND